MNTTRSSHTRSIFSLGLLLLIASLAACSTIRSDERNASDIEPSGPTDQNTPSK
ncbi:MAG: hypothetical protein JSS51_01575 [Planctomycetes bacterium]|nr:hypothetical protein [Planctomycetota bacterium]